MEHRDSPSELAVIEVINRDGSDIGHWQPAIGDETIKLRDRVLPSGNKESIIKEAETVLKKCVPPTILSGKKVGLVVGYVQSGKTMSFTALAALARDNGFRMVILFAGSSIDLVNQSRERLVRDLELNRNEWCPWRHIQNATIKNDTHNEISRILDEWNDPSVPRRELKTILLTVMKQHIHLDKLIEVLRRVDLKGVPTIVIDDEGDQAGLNTRVRTEEQSTTYRCITEIRDLIPHHSYLQYTATPQAPLLINIIDVLSPEFAVLLTAGKDYIGGRELFIESQNLIVGIPEEDIPSKNNPLSIAPDSLLQAIRLFIIGAAIQADRQDNPMNRSMMIHPSKEIEEHAKYSKWIDRAIKKWREILSPSNNDRSKQDLLDLFKEQYEELKSTVTDIPDFEKLTDRIRHALNRTKVREINKTNLEYVKWYESPYWILVGGQKMDRGFTLEGLTVTYMPRGKGVGNADTIQQRGRFYGYRRKYLGYCRVFLERNVANAFRDYVESEEDIRSILEDCSRNDKPLNKLDRVFILTRQLKPTRTNVLAIDYSHKTIKGWVYSRTSQIPEDIIPYNRDIMKGFIDSIQFAVHDGLDNRRGERKNKVARDVSLKYMQEELLSKIRIANIEDSLDFTALFRLIQLRLKVNPMEKCSIFLMSSGAAIERGFDAKNRIRQLFQGPPPGVVTYLGDREVKDKDIISAQLRFLTIREPGNPPIAEGVAHVAVYVPNEMARDLISQPQGD